MRLRDTDLKKHVHAWQLYCPPVDNDDSAGLLFEMPAPDRVWTYRRCECGSAARCKTADLAQYPKDLRAYADETWTSLDDPDDIDW